MGVTGIGGIFFRASAPDVLKDWYAKHLGVGTGEWGVWDHSAGPSVFSPIAADTDYFPKDKQWMLNLRVDGLDSLLDTLKRAGIELITKAEWNDPSIGRFARIHDPEGNPVELWEPPTKA